MPVNVTALKSFGQHFLRDKTVLEGIAKVIKNYHKNEALIEIGPGMGALTQYLIKDFNNVTCVEVDKRCVDYLRQHFQAAIEAHPPHLLVLEADFMKLDLGAIVQGDAGIVGNFPYNISSQIVFRILDHYEQIPFMVGMFQKEMGHRIAAGPGSKEYGVISVLAQLLYEVKVEFDIAPGSFSPPPKVMSSVISMKRKENIHLDFDLSLFRQIVKAAFNQRRKMLRNGLSGLVPKEMLQEPIFTQRAEQLSVQEYIGLAKRIDAEHSKSIQSAR